MRPTEKLMQEHRVIEQVILCLEEIANRCEAGEALDIDSARAAIDFFRVFADGCHHAKEEDLLFPVMEEKGFSRAEGPTGVMLHEHEEGRRHTRGMSEAIERIVAGNVTAQGAFIEHARSFAELLRQHIFKEDHCLFPMADQALSESDQQALSRSFEKADREEVDPAAYDKYLAVAKELVERLEISPMPGVAPVGGGCGMHHVPR